MSIVASHGQCLAKVSLGQPSPTTIQKQHSFGKKRIPLRRRVVLHHVLQVQSRAGFGRGTAKIKAEEIVEAESQSSSGTKKFAKWPSTAKLPGAAKSQVKDQFQAKSNKVVFVAGATGKVGSRTVRELLKLGFQVRAGTRNTQNAQNLFEDVIGSGQSTTASDDGIPFFSPARLFSFLKPRAGKVLEIVECDLEDAESIEYALGNAGSVVCCIGASEKEVLDVSGPYRIDFKAAANLIDAASSAQVNQFVLLTSLGTQKFGFPAAVLNLFWGVLVWKSKAEKVLLQSGLPYTIVRPGGMERPTDAYKETHNLVLAEADKLFGGQVSNLQVAELLASIVENPDVSVNKIIEAVAETTAPLRPIRELLEEIPAQDGTVSSVEPQRLRKSRPATSEENLAKEKGALALKEKEEKRIEAEKLAKAQKDEEEKRIKAENEEKEKRRLQALREKYEEEIEVARKKEEAANDAAAAALAEKSELEKRVAEVRAKAEAAALAASQAKAVEAAVLAAARKGNVLSDLEKEKIMESVKLARQPKEETLKESKPISKKKAAFSFFGKATPSTESATAVESLKDVEEEQPKVAADSKAMARAKMEAAAKLEEEKKQEEKAALEAKKKAERDKVEKEAKLQAEKEAAEAKKKEEAEAKRKEEEAEARRKEEEAEAKRKEEQERAEKEAERLKVEAEEAEARRKEEEAKEQAEKEAAEAKKKEEAEARRKEEEAEARRKEEEAKRIEEEAEARRKEEEAEAKRIEEEAEAKKKEEQERAEKEAERLKIEAEEAEARRKEEEAEAKRKEEQERAEKEAERLKVEAEEKAKALAEKEAEAKRKEEEVAKAKKKEEQEKAEEAERLKVEAEEKAKVLAEQEADAEAEKKKKELTKSEEAPAPARYKGFRWFWQQAEPDPSELEGPTEAMEQAPPSSTPLSPYTSYPGLKPPCPPTASTPTAKAEKVDTPNVESVSAVINKVEQTIEGAEKVKEVVIEEVISESGEDIEARARQAQETAAREREALERAKAATSITWLWDKTDPGGEYSTSSSSKGQVARASKSDDLPRSSRPLSPYAQFPNLKPPAPPQPFSPTPSSLEKEIKKVEALPGLEAVNGAPLEREVETKEKNGKSAFSFGFKWPWQQ